MKREIKFRAWLPSEKKMTHGHSITEWAKILTGTHGSDSFVDNNIYMQFTGLKDKNGVDIYEGDIVEVKGTKRTNLYYTEVIWNRQGFELKENKTYLNDNVAIRAVTLAIGNIYSNPELLTPLTNLK